MMDLTLLSQKNKFPLFVLEQLNRVPVDYLDKHLSIAHSNSTGSGHLEAGVVLLLHDNNSGYTFQLIKRSESVAQAGDISCPGGILEPRTDEMLSRILFKTEMIRSADDRSLNALPGKDEQTASLIRLFLMNALRESWEEIGLDPLNVCFLGALPSYSLTFFSRTIFPVVSLVREPFDYRLSDEVEKVMEIPVDYFFHSSFYAVLEIESGSGNSDSRYNMKFPCLVVPDGSGHDDILWGATFNIIVNFLQTITGNPVPPSPPTRTVKKMLPPHYASGKR